MHAREETEENILDVLDQNLTLRERELGVHVAGAGVLARLRRPVDAIRSSAGCVAA